MGIERLNVKCEVGNRTFPRVRICEAAKKRPTLLRNVKWTFKTKKTSKRPIRPEK